MIHHQLQGGATEPGALIPLIDHEPPQPNRRRVGGFRNKGLVLQHDEADRNILSVDGPEPCLGVKVRLRNRDCVARTWLSCSADTRRFAIARTVSAVTCRSEIPAFGCGAIWFTVTILRPDVRREPRDACSALLFDPGDELRERRFLGEASGSGADARRNPIGEGEFFGHVASRTRVDLAQPRKAIRWKSARRANKGRPQPPMDKSDLALDQATHEDIVAVADRSREREDLVTFRMRPPAAPNRLASDDPGKRQDRPLRRLEYDAALTNECESLP